MRPSDGPAPRMPRPGRRHKSFQRRILYHPEASPSRPSRGLRRIMQRILTRRALARELLMMSQHTTAPTAFSRAGIVGAGLMGRGIAQVTAQAGVDVLLFDTKAGSAEAARQAIAD